LRECELLEAVAKTENDLACGNYREESVDEHLKENLKMTKLIFYIRL